MLLCTRKVKMSALSNIEMSASVPGELAAGGGLVTPDTGKAHDPKNAWPPRLAATVYVRFHVPCYAHPK
jgi:hypothetical protein